MSTAARAARLTTTWDREVDIVVVGYGGSGATAAFVAAEAGAEVLVLEKGEIGGGNSACIAGSLMVTSVDDQESLTYLDWMCGGQTDEAVLKAYLDGLKDLPDFQSRLGFDLKPDPQPFRADGFFPEYPGAPGSGAFLGVSYIAAPGGAALYESIARLAEGAGAKVEYSTPVVRLIQHPDSREVLGVAAETPDGSRISVKARKGTILATGGFEFNGEMRQQYITHCPVLFLGSPNLTGDGITLAQQAGAKLWHMSSAAGPLYWGIEVEPGRVYVTYDFMKMAGFGHTAPVFKDAGSVIWVDKQGRRFHDETTETGTVHHGYGNREKWFAMDVDVPEFVHVPAYVVFDEKARAAGAVMTTLNSRTPAWSEDNLAEVEKGWIVQADTLEELAGKCRIPKTPGVARGGHLDAEQLVATVEQWNADCAQCSDSSQGREIFLTPLDTGPYYAVGPLYPTFVNTHGGPKHDPDQRVLDHADVPIPRLYAVGECGSMWGPYYNSMGDIAEFIISGRNAARHAVEERSWDAM